MCVPFKVPTQFHLALHFAFIQHPCLLGLPAPRPAIRSNSRFCFASLVPCPSSLPAEFASWHPKVLLFLLGIRQRILSSTMKESAVQLKAEQVTQERRGITPHITTVEQRSSRRAESEAGGRKIGGHSSTERRAGCCSATTAACWRACGKHLRAKLGAAGMWQKQEARHSCIGSRSVAFNSCFVDRRSFRALWTDVSDVTAWMLMFGAGLSRPWLAPQPAGPAAFEADPAGRGGRMHAYVSRHPQELFLGS